MFLSRFNGQKVSLKNSIFINTSEGSRPEKFFKVKSTNKMVKQEKAPWTQEKAPRKCNVQISK